MNTEASPDGLPVGEPRVVIRDLSKTYRSKADEIVALDRVSIDVAAGEIVVLLGPSGCGKTTLLRCVAGLERPDQGEISVHGEIAFSSSQKIVLPPEKRRLGMVFQSYALWPHMSVFDNLTYPLTSAGIKGRLLKERADAVLELVGLTRYAATYPGHLSGGQQQRVALARAIIVNPAVILFDEPLSNLDAQVRERLRLELLALQEEIGFSALYVTHDQSEAMALGDQIAVMNAGRLVQMGTPVDIHQRPQTRFVGQFVGSANELNGRIASRAETRHWVDTPAGRMEGVSGTGEAIENDTEVVVLIRPEHMKIRESAPMENSNWLNGLLERSIFMGAHVDYVVRVGTSQLLLRSFDERVLATGTEVGIAFYPSLVRIFRA